MFLVGRGDGVAPMDINDDARFDASKYVGGASTVLASDDEGAAQPAMPASYPTIKVEVKDEAPASPRAARTGGTCPSIKAEAHASRSPRAPTPPAATPLRSTSRPKPTALTKVRVIVWRAWQTCPREAWGMM